MSDDAHDLSRRLADSAEAVCRHYLPAGRREGAFWRVGDVRNASGRSLSVRLIATASSKGAAGKWTDRASGEHGDLLDVIRERRGLTDFPDILDEARAFLSLPRPQLDSTRRSRRDPDAYDRRKVVQRIIAETLPLAGSIAETYLRTRGIDELPDCTSLRFHPRCTCRGDDGQPSRRRPALIAIVTDPVLCERARRHGVEAITLGPRCGDFNDDLRALGVPGLRAYAKSHALHCTFRRTGNSAVSFSALQS